MITFQTVSGETLREHEEPKVLYPGRKPEHGKPHLMTLVDPDESDDDFDVEHHDSCLNEYGEVACDVSTELDQVGVEAFFAHVASATESDWGYCQVLVPGAYWIEAWCEVYRDYEYGDGWDAGLRLLYHEEAQVKP